MQLSDRFIGRVDGHEPAILDRRIRPTLDPPQAQLLSRMKCRRRCLVHRLDHPLFNVQMRPRNTHLVPAAALSCRLQPLLGVVLLHPGREGVRMLGSGVWSACKIRRLRLGQIDAYRFSHNARYRLSSNSARSATFISL